MVSSAQDALKKIGERLQNEVPHHIPSPPSQPRRACVALILRWHSKQTHEKPLTTVDLPKTIDEFFQLPWVKDNVDGRPELLFMQRATRAGDRWSGHVAYIGGKNEPGETDNDTVTREVREEIGLDLASDAFIELGRLDDREITSSYNRQLLMILVPFVFLQVVPQTPAIHLEKDEVASVEWIPLDFFLSPITSQSAVVESLTPRVFFGWRHKLLQYLLGTITFPAIDLPVNNVTTNDMTTTALPPRRFRLWGMTLAMTRDLVHLSDNDDLPFLSLVATPPRYSRRDIGWWIQITARTTLFWRQTTALSSSQRRAEWTKIYFGSLRTGVVMAMVTRALILAAGTSWLVRRCSSHFNRCNA